jgi:L-serine dehydratase
VTVYVSALELFSIGIGPSSSHTVGPMRAAARFAAALGDAGILPEITRVSCVLYGSLAATGVGHGTPDAVVAGLEGLHPEDCDPARVHGAWARAAERGSLMLGGDDGSNSIRDDDQGDARDSSTNAKTGIRSSSNGNGNGNDAGARNVITVPFGASDITFEPRTKLPEHPNALTLRAWTSPQAPRSHAEVGTGTPVVIIPTGPAANRPTATAPAMTRPGSAPERGATAAGTGEAGSAAPDDAEPGETPAFEQTWLSVGGGFVRLREEPAAAATPAIESELAFDNAAELLSLCAELGVGMCDIAWRTELAARSEQEVLDGLDAIARAMHECIERGLRPGTRELPGGLHVPRRAGAMRERLEACGPDQPDLPGEWMRAFALAVNEENAAGGRVVTAPTNGAAGILPAVLEYHLRFNPNTSPDDARRFLLTAAAVGSILKANASISGAEGGCQAEVGSACAMAAAGLTAVLGGTPTQVENAAEIAVEHHLGLTCDPVGGLVQIPCIERNAIASSTAVSAARLALSGDGHHIVPLDVAIETMRQTGADMSDRYKETSAAGLAVNVIEC